MDLVTVLLALRRRWLPIIVITLAGLSGGVYVATSTARAYQASTRTFFTIPAARGVQDSLAGVQLSTNLLSSYAQIATSASVLDEATRDVGPAPSGDRPAVGAAQEGNSLLLDIVVTDSDPNRARLLADRITDVLASRVALYEHDSTDKIEAQILDRAVTPTAPIRPQKKKDVGLGLVLGLGLGLAVALVLEALDRSLRTSEELATLSGSPLLAVIPKRKGGDAQRLIVTGEMVEPYRALRTALRFLSPDRPPVSLMITSATPGDGKSTTAANLAGTFSTSGERVLLVDGDLRRGQLTRVLAPESLTGLSAVITGQTRLEDALLEQGSMQFLPAGPLPPNPAELLGSQAMANLLSAMTHLADLIIIDVPPVTAVTDAVVLAPQVDAVVLVARHGHTRRGAISEAVRQLDAVSATLAGAVFNAVPRSEAAAYYGSYIYVPRRLNRR